MDPESFDGFMITGPSDEWQKWIFVIFGRLELLFKRTKKDQSEALF
jgi:hypothetical protein